MANPTLKCYLANNFIIEDRIEIDSKNDFSNNPDEMFDERASILSRNVRRNDWDWYLNYIDSIRSLALKNYASPACNMLDLGYIPLIYLPTCMLFMENDLFHILDVTGVPYIKLRKSSFVFNKVDLQGADAWISKMDAAELLGCAPHAVTSEMCIRRFLLNA